MSVTATSVTADRFPPGPAGLPLLGSMLEMQRDQLYFGLRHRERYGDVIGVRFGPWPACIVLHPEQIRHVLRDNAPNYDKNVIDYRVLRRVLGKGLLTSDGELWLRQRRLMQPVFHHQHVAAFGRIMADAASAMAERWEGAAREGRAIDVAAESTALTLRVVCEALFGVRGVDRGAEVRNALAVISGAFNDYVGTMLLPRWIPTPRRLRFRRAKGALDEIVLSLIQERRGGDGAGGDLLGMLLAARDEESGERMDDHQLRDEVMTLLLAGHETTAVALCWIWYLLAQHGGAERRLHEEVHSVLDGRRPGVGDLPRLPFVKMVVQEALRLYPPAWVFTRNARASDELGGYRIPAGTMVIISPFATHRHPALWERPEAFDPQRFAPEHQAERPLFSYLPFGGGPHLCIGNAFAMTEAQLVVATIAQRYRLLLPEGARVEPEALVTLRPRGGLPMIAQEATARR